MPPCAAPATRPAAPLLDAELPDAAPAPVAIKEKPLALPPRGTFATPRVEPEIEPSRTETVVPQAVAPAPVTQIADTLRQKATPRRAYLSDTAPLEDAPSIGPKMAERFASLGIHSVADFLGHDPHDMAELLDDNRIDAEVMTDWQDQAQLVIDVPGLRGGGAQLLVGAGYRTRDAIADADPVDLSADVLTFATSSDGKRILRDGNPPDLEKIKEWVTVAREALAA